MLGLHRDARGAHAQLDARLRLRLVLPLARAAGRVDRLFRIPGPDARRPGVRLALLSHLEKARLVIAATLYRPRGQPQPSNSSRIASTLKPAPNASIRSIRACCGRRLPARMAPRSCRRRAPPGEPG